MPQGSDVTVDGVLGKDVHVGINGSFSEQLQSFEFDRNIPTEERYQLGTTPAIEVIQRSTEYTGRLTWLVPDSNPVEQLLAGYSNSRVSWKNFFIGVGGSGINVEDERGGLTGAHVTRLEYACRVGGDLTGTATLRGTGWGSTHSFAASAISGVNAYTAKDVNVTLKFGVSGSAHAQRAQGFTVTCGSENIDLYELGTEDPVNQIKHRPTVECTVDWAESVSMLGNLDGTGTPKLTNADPGDIGIDVNGEVWMQCKDMVFVGEGDRANIGGFATRSYRYRSKGGDDTYYNFWIINT